MKPIVILDEASTPDGARLVLTEHDGTYAIRLNGQGLMDSRATESERVLGQVGTARLAGRPDARVLVGGLGLGFTLKSVLECVSLTACVTVAELLQPVIGWNRSYLAKLNGGALDDPRVEVRRADVFEVIQSRPAGFDVILLDIDNGPAPMVQKSNAGVYTFAGLLRLAAALRPRGRAVVWSAGDDPAFEDRLRRAGFDVELVRARRYPGARKSAVTLYVADKRQV